MGQISEPQLFEDPDGKKGYRIYRLLKHTEPHRMDLVEDYPLVQQAAEGKMRQRSVDTWVKEKLSGTYVNIIPSYQGCKFEHPWMSGSTQRP